MRGEITGGVQCCFALLLLTALTGTTTSDATTISEVGSKRILVLLPVASRSHHSIVSTLITALMDRGHNVTIVSSREQKSKNPRLREVLVKEPLGTLLENVVGNYFANPSSISFIQRSASTFRVAPIICKVVLEDPKALALRNETFDLVISTPFIFQEPMLAFAHHFGCPSVNLHPLGYTYSLNQYSGGATNPAYVPNLRGTSSKPDTFLERLENILTSVFLSLAYDYYYLPKADAQMRAVFPEAPPIAELIKNISLTLITSNNAIMHPVPLAPSVIEVGGIHIKPGEPLPAELKAWIEDSKDGFVYFSLGTNVNPSLLPAGKRDVIFKSFGKLKQRVLVKWNGDPPPHPGNCRFEEWVPQQEVLAHPNLKVFITHGGLLSTQESVYFGTAILGMPIFGDQFFNMEAAIKLGFGLQVSIHDLTEEKLDAALHEVISNPKYRERSRELSLRFRLDPTPPLDKAVHYIEQLIKLGSFKHLQPSSVHLHWYQYMLLDVVAFILIALYTAYRMTRFMCSRLFGRCCKSLKDKRD